MGGPRFLKTMKLLITVSVLALMFLSTASFVTVIPSVFASTNGNATSCSGLATCSYNIGAGAGSASTIGGEPAYVGYNFTFYGGSLSFKLPGETLVSYDAGVYNGMEINTKVFTSTAGLIYHVTGSFAAPDYNTGKIVKGTTNGYVGIKGHSGRGGGINFVLVNGTITFKLTSLYATVTKVSCNPTLFLQGSSTTCTATVTDLLASSSVPTGHVIFSSTLGFSPKKCTLSSGTCSVKIFPIAGIWPVYASYAGDSLHFQSSVRGPELYVGCPPDQCD